MPRIEYDWKRFWSPRGESINLSYDGYLPNPDDKWDRHYNSNIVPFEAISETSCLALLGEPGIGKSYTLESVQKAMEAQVAEDDTKVLNLNLRSYGSEDRLVRALFENGTFGDWQNGDYRLYIFLDSLDECLLRIDTVATLLVDELKRFPVNRLSLRIACRTADWPNNLEEGLKELWGEEAFRAYELAPLRKQDVIEAAQVNSLDSEAFMEAVSAAAAVPFAIKPVSLEFLINTYGRRKQLPSSQAELYLEGCRLLCEDTNEDRHAARLTGDLSTDQRFRVAARIAAVTLLSNRDAIWKGLDLGEVPDEDIVLKKLAGGTEQANKDEFPVTEASIQEVLNTGLFSARGPQRMGWAHQTYAEYLAAHYLSDKMTNDQIMSLLTHPDDPEGRLVPQLRSTAAWLVSLAPGRFFQNFMEADAEVLLYCDLSTVGEEDKRALVDTLLSLHDEEKLLDDDWELDKQYAKLHHPNLADQLRPYICDPTKGFLVRRVAINIAKACKLRALQDDLLEVALDDSQLIATRAEAACAVVRVGDKPVRAKLKPLATDGGDNDPRDELKGYALKAIWPNLITAKELFSVLTPPKAENFIGAYSSFLTNDLVPSLQEADLPIALQWAGKEESLYRDADLKGESLRRDIYLHERVIDAIILKAWNNLDQPGISKGFAKIALLRLEQHRDILDKISNPDHADILASNEERRRKVLQVIPSLIADSPDYPVFGIASSMARQKMILKKDVPWMIERLRETISEKEQTIWADFVGMIFDGEDAEQVDLILTTCQHNTVLSKACRWLLRTWNLSSDDTQKERERYRKRNRREESHHSHPLFVLPPAERIKTLVKACEEGNLDNWWQLNRVMTLESTSTRYENELESDLTSLPGWRDADRTLKARLVAVAKRYIQERDAKQEEWLGTNISYSPALSGYRAFRLLLQEEEDFVARLDQSVWKKWAAIMIGYPLLNAARTEEPHNTLLRLAYAAAPEEIIESLMTLIDQENRELQSVWIVERMQHCWDERLANALLSKVKDTQLKPGSMQRLLDELILHGVQEARNFVEELIQSRHSHDQEQQAKAVRAAVSLFLHSEDVGWPIIWPLIEKEPSFGEKIFEDIVRDRPHSLGQNLTEDQWADVYIWLSCQYPHAEDPQEEGGHLVTPRESIGNWRNSILNFLQELGTVDACRAIQKIYETLPGLDFIKWVLIKAREKTRAKTWIPPQPEEILQLSRDRKSCLVQNGSQLLAVLIESLKRAEEKLQGETPEAKFLWDKGKDAYSPKDENSFSDWIKVHLENDLKMRGIIANREVEIRRGEGTGQGERTDIHVNAIIQEHPEKNLYEKITAIIEVKGCWNQELKDSMQTQLAERYLKDNQCDHGLYLVGWFPCEQWDEKDWRKSQTPKMTLEQAREKFACQARELSRNGKTIESFVMNTALR